MNWKMILLFTLVLVLPACGAAERVQPASNSALPTASPPTAQAASEPAPTPALPTTSPPTIQAASEPAGPAAKFVSQIEAFMTEQAEEHGFSGIVFIADGNDVLLNQGYGFADQETQTPHTETTQYRIGSLTKQFTAAAILLLEEEGKLNVQDPICIYIEDCPPAWQPITIHHLLIHTAGLYSPEISSNSPISPAELLKRFKNLSLLFEPGSKYAYSNSNYTVLGIIIEKVSGQPYGEFLVERVFTPLGMKNTGYATQPPGLATGYTYIDAEISFKAQPVDASVLFAGAGLYSTAEDLLRWNQALYGGSVLSPAQLKQMITPHVDVSTVPGFEGWHYGYGLAIGTNGGHQVIRHIGSAEGFRSDLSYYVNDDVTIVILSNLETTDPLMISNKIGQIIFE